MASLHNIWNTRIWNHPERVARLIFLLYVLVFPGSLISVAFGFVTPETRWFGGVLLSIQGIALLAWLWHAIGRASVLPSLTILIGSCVVEYLGATTDVIFGPYDYTGVLGVRVAGIVPLAILFAWIMATYGSWMIVDGLPLHLSRVQRAVLTGAVITVFDIQIEPVAVIIHEYWVWYADGWYYGVPFQNFVAWFVVGFIFSLLVDTPLRTARARGASRLPLIAIGGSCVMFLVMNGVAGHLIAVVLSIVMIGVIVWVWRLYPLDRREP